MVANTRKREREESKRNGREASNDQEVILNTYLRQHNTDRVHFPDSAEKRPSRLHTRLMRFNSDQVSSYLQLDINKFPSAK